MSTTKLDGPVANVTIVGSASLLMGSLITAKWTAVPPDVQETLIPFVPVVAAAISEGCKKANMAISRRRAKGRLKELKESTEEVLRNELVSPEARETAQKTYDTYCLLEIHPSVDLEMIENHKQPSRSREQRTPG